MDVLNELKNTYIKKRKATIDRTYLSFRGFFLRLFNAEKYWDELTLEDARLLDFGVQTLTGILTQKPKTRDELKTYQLALKNTNAKLTERGNFLLAMVTLMSALGVTKFTEACEWTREHLSGWAMFAIFGTTIFFAVQDTVRVRNRAAIHEELINIIERYLQATPTADSPPLLMPARAQAQVPAPPSVSDLAMNRLIRMIFNRGTSVALFKAGIVLLGIALIGMSQTGLALYDKELDAYGSKFKIEAVLGRTLEQIHCPSLTAYKADCQIAQHKMEAVNSGLDLLDTVVRWTYRSGIGLVILSGILFISTPIVRAFPSMRRLNWRS
ncbi:hypothetical protein C4E44_09420 [Pseudomonas sp. MWU12-2312b]|uniref:hypothetical protein n=1 Tax=Pseudomonas moorei TaxID=395599 RepID=UPI000D42FEF8|nr:hypothetical protein [Pseudomonas moorei]PPA04374.1 hypothetical protein C4E44_09420 [Pseudomonas sp. MWU12-2312b]